MANDYKNESKNNSPTAKRTGITFHEPNPHAISMIIMTARKLSNRLNGIIIF